MRKTVVFDLDGTLADTSGDLIAAANAVFEARGEGAKLVPVEDRSTALRGGMAMLSLGYERGGSEGPEDYQALLMHYEANIDRHTFLYPGALECVEGLRSDGYGVAICTNKPEGLAETLMSRLGVRDRFHSLIGADTLTVRKPDPAPYIEAVTRAEGDVARSLIIGDTETDAKTARAVGVPVVLVGFEPDEDVARHDPDHIITHFDQLRGVVRDLIG